MPRSTGLGETRHVPPIAQALQVFATQSLWHQIARRQHQPGLLLLAVVELNAGVRCSLALGMRLDTQQIPSLDLQSKHACMRGTRLANSSLSPASGDADGPGAVDTRRPAGPETDVRDPRDGRATPFWARAAPAAASAASMRLCMALRPCVAPCKHRSESDLCTCSGERADSPVLHCINRIC